MVGTLLKIKKIFFFLEKKFSFKNFLDSQKFVNKVGNIAETEGHHPELNSSKSHKQLLVPGTGTQFYPLNLYMCMNVCKPWQ